MGFDLYFASMNDDLIKPWFYENDCPLLYSQINDRSRLNKRFASEINTNGKLFVDSGAHSAHTKGIQLDLEEYIDFINRNTDKMTVFAQVDKIPGQYLKPKTQKDFLEAPELSWENYLYMHEKVKEPDKLMPVFHQGENLKYLKQMCDYRFPDGSKAEYVGLSPRGDVSLKAKYDFSASCFEVIQNSSNPNLKTHALGATSLEMLERLPYYSADSTTWVLVSAYGQVWIPESVVSTSTTVGVKLGVSKENIVHSTATQTYWEQTPEIKKRLDDYFESIGTNIEELSVSHSARALSSAKFVKSWCDSYEYKGLKSFTSTKKLF